MRAGQCIRYRITRKTSGFRRRNAPAGILDGKRVRRFLMRLFEREKIRVGIRLGPRHFIGRDTVVKILPKPRFSHDGLEVSFPGIGDDGHEHLTLQLLENIHNSIYGLQPRQHFVVPRIAHGAKSFCFFLRYSSCFSELERTVPHFKGTFVPIKRDIYADSIKYLFGRFVVKRFSIDKQTVVIEKNGFEFAHMSVKGDSSVMFLLPRVAPYACTRPARMPVPAEYRKFSATRQCRSKGSEDAITS